MSRYITERNLKFVQISITTSTLDNIKKVRRVSLFILLCSVNFTLPQDRAAKFVDQLSAIGGTMGLLTGFSLISGVEILYFSGKILLNIFEEKIGKKKNIVN